MRLLSLFFFIGVMALGVLAPAPTEARTIGERAREERAGPGAAAQRRPYFLWLSTPSLLTRADARADAAELAWRERNAALIEANAAGTGPVLEAPRRVRHGQPAGASRPCGLALGAR
jgi:hypothetical protein